MYYIIVGTLALRKAKLFIMDAAGLAQKFGLRGKWKPSDGLPKNIFVNVRLLIVTDCEYLPQAKLTSCASARSSASLGFYQ